jgi:hypothetical protein
MISKIAAANIKGKQVKTRILSVALWVVLKEAMHN